MNLGIYRKIKRLKGIVYFLVFVAIGLSIFYENGEGKFSTVAVYIDHVYPILLFAAFFIISGTINLYIGWRDYDWHVLGFAVVYLYTIAVIIAYVERAVPFIAIPVYAGLSLSTAFDVAMDVFVLPRRKEIIRNGGQLWRHSDRD